MSLTRLVSDEPQMAAGGRFYLLYVLFALLLFPVHESGHYWTYRILGVPLRMTLNTASPSDPSLRRPIAEIAGPIVNLVVASFAGLAFHVSGRRWRWWAALALYQP